VADTPYDEAVAWDVQAEQAVLACCLTIPDAIPDILAKLRPASFYRPAHQLIYELIRDMFSRGDPVDMVTVLGKLMATGQLARVGNGEYLHELAAMRPVQPQALHYAATVADHALRRRISEAGTRIAGYGRLLDVPAQELATRALAATMELTGDLDADGARPLAELVPEAIDAIDANASSRPGGILTGFADLDALLLGLHGGQMVIIAARPGVGKSMLAVDTARSCAIRQGRPCLFFSLEMSRLEVVNRVIAATCRVNIHAMRAAALRGAKLAEEDWERIVLHYEDMARAPLWVDDSPMLTVADVRARAHRMKAAHGLDLVIVDYLQLMSSLKRTENRQQEVSEMSRSLKLLAKELDVPVVALSQLNRGLEQRQDKKPLLSDLRDSGSLEQDADVVILLHREDVHDKETPRAGEADFIVAKHRGGPTATITTACQAHYARFADMAPDIPAPV
jgi:replicative DNA helicase